MVGIPSRPPFPPGRLLQPIPLGLGLAREELSCRGHPGTRSCPECPAPHPHGFSSFLPFSFLINHTLLPNLNMEMPRPWQCNYSRGRAGCPALGCGEYRGIASFLVCVKLCAQKASPYLSV